MISFKRKCMETMFVSSAYTTTFFFFIWKHPCDTSNKHGDGINAVANEVMQQHIMPMIANQYLFIHFLTGLFLHFRHRHLKVRTFRML